MMQHLGAWVGFVPTALIAIAVLAVPGLVLGLALRLRGWWLLATAAPLSVSLIAVASIVAGWVGIPWGVLPVLGLTIVASFAALAWMRWVGTPAPRTLSTARPRIWPTVIAVVVPAAIISLIIVRGIGEPSLIAQRYDNFFHLNAIQYVLDTGSASPFWVGSMTAPGNLLFYPSGWHAVGSLIAQLAGSGVPMASNALVLITAAVVWPLSAILLARTLFGGSALVTVSAGVLSAATPAFPYLPLHYGPLYPLFLGLALAPVGIAAVIRALRPGVQLRRQDLVLLVVLLIPGIAVAHPGAFMGVLALSVPAALALAWRLWTTHASTRARLGIAAGLVGLIAAGVLVLKFVRPPASEIYWPVTGSLATAIGEVVTAAVFNYPVAGVFAILILAGVIGAFRRPTYTRSIALGMGFIGAVLYIIVAGSPYEILRTWLSGPWYNNPPRLASIWALAAVPLAASGAVVIVRWIVRRVRVAPLRRQVRRFGSVALAVVAILLAVTTQGEAIRQAAADTQWVYGQGVDEDGPILSAGEYRLLSELDEYVPEDAVVAGDPWTGTSFAYALSGRMVLMPHLLMDETPAAETINTELATEGDDPAVCAALRETGVRFVLDFDGGTFMESPGGFDGVEDLEDSPYVRLVAEEPGARLYEVTSCGLVK